MPMNKEPLRMERDLLIMGSHKHVACQLYGDGTDIYPYVVRIKIEGLPFGVFVEKFDFTLDTDSTRTLLPLTGHFDTDMRWNAIYGMILKKIAAPRIHIAGEIEYTITDCVRLGSTSTRPDLYSWLHPYNDRTMPYAVELYEENIVRRYLVRANDTRIRETIFLNNGQRSSYVNYSYARWKAKHSSLSHMPLWERAKRMIDSWQTNTGEGLYYEFADLFNPADSHLANPFDD